MAIAARGSMRHSQSPCFGVLLLKWAPKAAYASPTKGEADCLGGINSTQNLMPKYNQNRSCSRFQDQVEWRLGRAAEAGQPALAGNLAKSRLAGLCAEA